MGKSVKYIIAIDDTDNLKSYSTGIVAENLSKVLGEKLIAVIFRPMAVLEKELLALLQAPVSG